jgi:hypothetical protein
MFPHPMFMAMIGHTVADMQRADLEEHVQQQEVYAEELRQTLERTAADYQELHQELAVFKEQWGKKIIAYEALKPVLQKLAEYVCDDEFRDQAARVRQMLLELLERLP